MPGQSTFNLNSSYTNSLPTQSLPNSNGNPSGSSAGAASSGTLTDAGTATCIVNLQPGTGTNQADTFFRDSQAIANTSSSAITVTYNLAALPQGGGSSTTVAMARVRKLIITNTSISTTATDQTTSDPGAILSVSPATSGSRGWTNGLGSGGSVPIVPGGVFAMVQPDAPGVVVTSGSNDSFTVSVPANTVGAWQVVVEGCSA